MNYGRIYQYRFQQVSHEKKKVIWKIIADYFYELLGRPTRILDSAGGMCEFINAVPSAERWTVDIVEEVRNFAAPEVKLVIGDILEVELPENYFDAVFISNFLEHLRSQEEVAFFLERMHRCLKPGGKLGVIGPNFKYCYREYFDFADHTVVLSELGVAEHLYGAGFKINKSYARFLPLSFRGGLPVHPFLVKLYMNMPFIWWVLGKQFLFIAEKVPFDTNE
jgi:ubiquinone/menaquinone biosynthesis C-methylase UbiE